MNFLALAILRGFHLSWNEEPSGQQLGKGFLWTSVSAASEKPRHALDRCASASSTSRLLICLPLVLPLGFSSGHCCQKQLLGLARAVKSHPALLDSHYRVGDCSQGGEMKWQSTLLCPSPSLGRRKIRIAGKGCFSSSTALQGCAETWSVSNVWLHLWS